MKYHTLNAYFNTTAGVDLFNLTHDVKRALRESQVLNGLIVVSLTLGAGSIVILENDKAIQNALKELVASFVLSSDEARPKRRSGTGREDAHLRSLLLPQSANIPIRDGKLLLGAWQEVWVYDFDDRIGRREVSITVMGDGAEEKK